MTQEQRFTSIDLPGELTLTLHDQDLRTLARARALTGIRLGDDQPSADIRLMVPFRNERHLSPELDRDGSLVLFEASRAGVSVVISGPGQPWLSRQVPWEALNLPDAPDDTLDLLDFERNPFPHDAREALVEQLALHFPDLEAGDSGAGFYGYDMQLTDNEQQLEFNLGGAQEDDGRWLYSISARAWADEEALELLDPDLMDDDQVLGHIQTHTPGDLLRFLRAYHGEGAAPA